MKQRKQPDTEQQSAHPWRVRLISLFAAAFLIAGALWVSDARIGAIDIASWKQGIRDWWAKDWFPEKDERYAIPPQLPTPPSPSASTVLPKELPGLDSSISKTPQALILVSTQRGRNAREGTAQLGTHPENPQTYAAGALLANGARLLEIYDDRVVLERDNERTTLYLERSGKKTDSALVFVGGVSSPPKSAVPSREVLTDYIHPSPVYDGQQLKGFEVYAGQRSAVFSQLGLENGDVVLTLNHQPLLDPKQAIDLFRELTTGTAMSATIERRGKTENISINGAVIVADQEKLAEPQESAGLSPLGPAS